MTWHLSTPKPKPREKREPKKPRAKNAKRSASEWARCYGSEERVEWVQGLRCVVPGGDKLGGKCDNVHIEGAGMGRKASYDKIVPMCKWHHRELHRVGREEFEGTYYVDLAALALDTERCYRRAAGHALPKEQER